MPSDLGSSQQYFFPLLICILGHQIFCLNSFPFLSSLDPCPLYFSADLFLGKNGNQVPSIHFCAVKLFSHRPIKNYSHCVDFFTSFMSIMTVKQNCFSTGCFTFESFRLFQISKKESKSSRTFLVTKAEEKVLFMLLIKLGTFQKVSLIRHIPYILTYKPTHL